MRITKNWQIGVSVDYDTHTAIESKVYRIGIKTSDLVRMAIQEYLERNPEQNESEEAKKYPKRNGGLYD